MTKNAYRFFSLKIFPKLITAEGQNRSRGIQLERIYSTKLSSERAHLHYLENQNPNLGLSPGLN